MKKLLKSLIVFTMIFALVGCAATTDTPETTDTPKEGMTAGSYVAVAKGFAEDMNVEVVVSDTEILEVNILENNETPEKAKPAFDVIPSAIVENQSILVDSVAGATMTSDGIKLAVEQALTDAGANIDEFKKKVETVSVVDAELTNDEVPTEWDMTYDVIVVGAGFAGMSAAHSAQEAGANTLLIDKMPAVGGNSAINGGQYAAYTSDIAKDFQTKLNLPADTAEQHIADTIAGGGDLPQEELVEIMVHGSPIYFNKLLENGLVVRETLAMPGGHNGYRTYVTERSIGADITSIQEQMVKKSGATLMLNTKLVQLFKDDSGVVGIQVATNEGNKTIKAEKGVILSTGGFGANVEMRQQYDPMLDESFPTTNNPSSTGEGLVMAMELGAGVTGLEWIQRYPYAIPDTGVLDTVAVIPFTGPSYGVVNVDIEGKRFVNESETRDNVSNAIQATEGPTAFAILNRDLATWVPEADMDGYIESGRIISGETIEELVTNINALTYKGETINMDAAVLEETITNHNSYIADGNDPEFNKPIKETMVTIESGTYLAIPIYPSVHHTMGGVTITPNAEVLDVDGKVINGLFAAGEVTGGVHGTNRLGSNADADAMAFGMVAGTYAASGVNPVSVE